MIVEGAAVLSGSGTLTAVGAAEYQAKASLSGEGTITARGLVPFTHDMMAEVVLELSDREIYNDIRSEVDETITTVDVTPAEYESGEIRSSRQRLSGIGDSVTITLTAPVAVIRWLSAYPYNIYGITYGGFYNQAQCEAAGGSWVETGQACDGITAAYAVTVYVSKRTDTYIELFITNSLNRTVEFNVAAPYQYITRDEIRKTFSETRKLKVRSTDSSSIAKYGRRVMNLVWPLGQTQEQMQELVDTYLLRYKEPMPQMKVRLLGINDTMVAKILNTHISDKLWVEDTTLEVADYFFVNAMSINHHVSGLLEATWDIEQIRDYERTPLFTLDTSILGGPHILGW